MLIMSILQRKGREVATVRDDATAAEAVAVLARRQIGALVVVDGANQPVGLVAERDLVAGLARDGADLLGVPVGRMMKPLLRDVSPDTTVRHAMEIMTEQRMRHLPVFRDGGLVGLVSIGDVVKARLELQENEVDALKGYLAGVS